MTQATIAAKVNQTLDIHRNFTAKISFYCVVAVDDFADFGYFGFAQLMYALAFADTGFVADFLRVFLANAMDVLKRDNQALGGWNVNTCNTSHKIS